MAYGRMDALCATGACTSEAGGSYTGPAHAPKMRRYLTGMASCVVRGEPVRSAVGCSGEAESGALPCD